MLPFIADYFLHIDLIVPANSQPDFERKMREFLSRGGFKRLDPANDYHLTLALRTPRPFVNSRFEPIESDQLSKRSGRIAKLLTDAGQANKEVYRYVHLWHLPDTRDLDVAAVMNACADDTLYTELDAFVGREIQDLVVRIRWPGDSPRLPPTPDGGKFLRVVRQFRTKDLGAYLYNVPAILPTLRRAGVNSLGHYENATGPLNVFTEFWHTSTLGANPGPQTMATAFQPPAPPEARRIWEQTQMLSPNEDRELLIPYI